MTDKSFEVLWEASKGVIVSFKSVNETQEQCFLHDVFMVAFKMMLRWRRKWWGYDEEGLVSGITLGSLTWHISVRLGSAYIYPRKGTETDST